MSLLSADDLDPSQRAAVDDCIDQTKRCAAVTGPAGSGKTTIMRLVYEALDTAGYSPVFAAPTGKAARRIYEATGISALTIHKLLEYGSPREICQKTGKVLDPTQPRRDRDDPLDFQTVIVDEYAMVNRELHANLVNALPRGGRLLVFGDLMQLPPIESNATLAREPSAFAKMLEVFKGTKLEKVHRQNAESGILAAAQSILKGIPPRDAHDFKRVLTEKPVDVILDMITSGETDYTSLANQIITPGNKSWVGTYKLNHQIQPLVTDDTTRSIKLERHPWQKTMPVTLYIGDKVIMNKNWYSLEGDDGSEGLLNGEVGHVTDIDELDVITIKLEDRSVKVPPVVMIDFGDSLVPGYPHKDLSLAYALTTHKCQGSQFKHVAYVMNRSLFTLLNRRNFYTGITRAAEYATLITDTRGLSVALSTREPRVFDSNRGDGAIAV